jgi:cullin 1
LKNQALIAEVVSQISQRFTPKVADIKKAIETLLEKEYIERAEGQRDVSALIALVPRTHPRADLQLPCMSSYAA